MIHDRHVMTSSMSVKAAGAMGFSFCAAAWISIFIVAAESVADARPRRPAHHHGLMWSPVAR